MKTDIRYDTIGRAAILSIAILLFTCLPTLATDYMNMEDMKLTIPTMEASQSVKKNRHTFLSSAVRSWFHSDKQNSIITTF